MIALDIEASGTDYGKHSIVSLGAVDCEDSVNQFYDECRVWEGAHIDPESLEICGFTEAEVTDPMKKSEAELVRAFIAWAADRRDWTLMGQNPSFDRGFLEAACHRAHIDFPFPHRTIDVHSLAYMHMVKRGVTPPFDLPKHRTALSLNAALQYVGIPSEPDPHNALTGALCHAEAANRLLYDRGLLPDFEMFPVPWTLPRKF